MQLSDCGLRIADLRIADFVLVKRVNLTWTFSALQETPAHASSHEIRNPKSDNSDNSDHCHCFAFHALVTII